jgi:hypothetical protein
VLDPACDPAAAPLPCRAPKGAGSEHRGRLPPATPFEIHTPAGITMSLFTSKKVEWRRTMQTRAQSSGQFNQLDATLGRDHAKKFLDLVYGKWCNELCVSVVRRMNG